MNLIASKASDRVHRRLNSNGHPLRAAPLLGYRADANALPPAGIVIATKNAKTHKELGSKNIIDRVVV